MRTHAEMINERISSLTTTINRLVLKLDRIDDRLSAIETLQKVVAVMDCTSKRWKQPRETGGSHDR